MRSKKSKTKSRGKYFALLIVLILPTIYLFLQSDLKEEKISTEIKFEESGVVSEEKKEEKKEEVSVAGLDLLGKAKSSFSGSTEGRMKNIKLGIEKINEKIIEPGQEFSFKKSLGEITKETGFSEERIFLNGEVTKGVGGGLCQVSTALFRATLDSGLPITERSNHSFTVSRYDVGLDATYSNPGPDFKFVNNTKNLIVIKGRTENESVIFEFYGKSDGRIASTTEPEITNVVDFPPTRYLFVPELSEGERECVNTPQIGYTANVKYGVMYPDGQYKEQDFISRYRPLQRICYIVGDKIKTFDINATFENRL
jgi:vancomycin resistance protein YoaR